MSVAWGLTRVLGVFFAAASLRRIFVTMFCMYENVQAPMMEAAAGGNSPAPSSASHNPFKSMLQGGSATGNLVKVPSNYISRQFCSIKNVFRDHPQCNAAQPWASAAASSHSAAAFNPFAAFGPGAGAPAANPFAAMGAGGFGGGQMPSIDGLAT